MDNHTILLFIAVNQVVYTEINLKKIIFWNIFSIAKCSKPPKIFLEHSRM